MIARLRGLVAEREHLGTSGRVIVECAGIGYDVLVSLITLESLPPDGDEVTLRVHTHATENRVALYGFRAPEERELFDSLITVQNVGPRTAIEILSGAASAGDVARMVAEADVKALTQLKGVGKKTAEMIVAKLRDKCELMLATWRASGRLTEGARTPTQPPRAPTRPPILEDVASALGNLGWRSNEVQKIMDRLEVPPGATVETLLRDAIRAMPR